MANFNSLADELGEIRSILLRIERLALTIAVPQATEPAPKPVNAAQEHEIGPNVQKRRGRPPSRRD